MRITNQCEIARPLLSEGLFSKFSIWRLAALIVSVACLSGCGKSEKQPLLKLPISELESGIKHDFPEFKFAANPDGGGLIGRLSNKNGTALLTISLRDVRGDRCRELELSEMSVRGAKQEKGFLGNGRVLILTAMDPDLTSSRATDWLLTVLKERHVIDRNEREGYRREGKWTDFQDMSGCDITFTAI